MEILVPSFKTNFFIEESIKKPFKNKNGYAAFAKKMLQTSNEYDCLGMWAHLPRKNNDQIHEENYNLP